MPANESRNNIVGVWWEIIAEVCTVLHRALLFLYLDYLVTCLLLDLLFSTGVELASQVFQPAVSSGSLSVCLYSTSCLETGAVRHLLPFSVHSTACLLRLGKDTLDRLQFTVGNEEGWLPLCYSCIFGMFCKMWEDYYCDTLLHDSLPRMNYAFKLDSSLKTCSY